MRRYKFDWKVPGPTCPTHEDELGGPLGPALQGGRIPRTAMGAQGGHTHRARSATASSPWEQGQGDVEGAAVLSRCCGPTEKGARCSGPGVGAHSHRVSWPWGQGLKSPPAIL